MSDMKIENDPLFDAAMNFLENGGDLPPNASAHQRFVFQAAVNRRMFREVVGSRDAIANLAKSVEDHHKKVHLADLLKSPKVWGYALITFVVVNAAIDVGHPLVVGLIKAWTGVQLP